MTKATAFETLKFVMLKLKMDRCLRISKILNLWLAVFFFLGNIENSLACPSMCVCGERGGSPFVNCEKKNLLVFPRNISRNTEDL